MISNTYGRTHENIQCGCIFSFDGIGIGIKSKIMNKTKDLHAYSKYCFRAGTFHSIQFQSRSTIIQETSPFYLQKGRKKCAFLLEKWHLVGVVLKLFGAI